MAGFTGIKTATSEQLPDAVVVMDPFHVVRVTGDALDRNRFSVRLAAPASRSSIDRPMATDDCLVNASFDQGPAPPGHAACAPYGPDCAAGSDDQPIRARTSRTVP